MAPRVPREKGWCVLEEKELWPLRRNSWSAEIGSFISIPDLQLRSQVVRVGMSLGQFLGSGGPKHLPSLAQGAILST